MATKIVRIESDSGNRRGGKVILTIDGGGNEYDGVLSIEGRRVTWDPKFGEKIDDKDLEDVIDCVRWGRASTRR